MKPLRVIISGGGSGGHIFPALAIANALNKRRPDCAILFVGANGRMEMEKIPAAGYEIKGLNIAGIQRGSIVKNLFLPFQIVSSLWNALQIVRAFKPDVAIGVGGYASGPLLRAASFSGVPTVIQEQNAIPGLTNKLLSRQAKVICAAYPEIKQVYPTKRVVITGNPIRSEIVNSQSDRKEAFQYFGLDETKPTILIIGGSLGARTFNEAVKHSIETIKGGNFQIIWQTGKGYYEKYKDIAANIPNLKCLQFIDRMDYAYTLADVVISRGGALSISELEVVGKPTVFVPSPNVTDDQQTHNVMALVNKNAAIIIKDSEAKETLIDAAIELLMDELRQKELAQNIKKLGITDAADRIVDEIERVIG